MDQNIPAEGSGTSQDLQKIAALIPAHNARDTIGAVVAGTKRHIPYVLVVDDGSGDDTGKEASRAGATVIRHVNNRGKGEALKTGFRFLVGRGFDAVLTLDADAQHSPDDIPALVSRFTSADDGIVIGTRMADRDKIPRYRLIPNLVGNFFLSRASGQPIADSQCGMRIYSARVLDWVDVTSSRFDAEAELLIKAGRLGFTFSFVPISTIYREGGVSHFVPVKDTYLISLVYLKSLFWKRERLQE
jgi:glycosyltransferase involved in cell wall biosynthesis